MSSKSYVIFSDFRAGELTSLLDGQIEFPKYYSGCKTLENFIPLPQGPATNRTGFRYIADSKYSSTKKCRLVSFEFSTEQAYIIEFGHQYCRFYMNQGQIVTVDSPTKLLLSMNGSDASTTFTDESDTIHTVTAVNNAQLDTADKKFGTASGLFDGTLDYLTVPDHTDWDFSGGIWTVDTWIKVSEFGTNSQTIFFQRTNANNYIHGYVSPQGQIGLKVEATAGTQAELETADGVIVAATDTYTTLLLSMNGSDGGTTFTDDSASSHNISVAGNANTDTDDKKFGTASGLFDGTGDYLTVDSSGSHTDFNFSGGIWTIDCWIKIDTLGATSQAIFAQKTSSTSYMIAYVATAGELVFSAYNVPTWAIAVVTPEDTIETGTWYHIEIVENGDNWYLFVDGILKGSVTDTDRLVSYTDLFHIGANNSSGSITNEFDGWIDEFRVSKGVARHTSNFTPETVEYKTSAWYHIEFVENGNDWHIFVDGVSKTTLTDSSRPANYTGLFYIGAENISDPAIAGSFDGWMDEFRVSNGVARHTSDFTPPTSEYTTSPAGSVYEIATPYLESELPELQFTQSADTLYIVHPNHVPITLSRTGHTAWSLNGYNYKRGPFLTTNITVTTITPSADTGNGITLTASTSIFNSDHIGGLWRVKDGVVNITAYSSGTSVTANVQAEPDGTSGDLDTGPGATTDWAEAAWSHDEGWPSSLTFFEQRLWWSKIQTLYSSKSGDYSNMEVGTADDNAIIYTIAARHVNEILWLSSGKVLVAGTAGGEFKIAASSVEEAITPLNVRVVKESSNGSAYHEAIEVKDVVLYLQKAKRQILEFTYQWESQTYVSPDMTDLAQHITKDYIVYMAYQQFPFSILWCVRNDGVLAAMTYDRLRQMVAWHRHITTDSTGDSSFESVAVIPTIETKANDEVWVVVNRTINGSTVRYIEMLEQYYDGEALNSDECFFVDSGLTYNGASTSTITGLGHLEGETVAVIGDGIVQASKTVSGSQITIDSAASRVHVGLAYDSVLQTMRVEQADNRGTSQGRKKRINQAVLRLKDVKQYKYGDTPTGTFKEITETVLTSGDKEVEFIKGWGREGYITFKQEKPLPATVVGIIAELEVT